MMPGQKRKSVAILQPSFLPWIGWFDIAEQVDLLIILDDVAFSKQSWQQRNRIRTAQGLAFITVPVRTAGRLGQKIVDAELADAAFVRKIENTIKANYARAPCFPRYFPEFCDMLSRSTASEKLVDLNCSLIEWLLTCLGISTPTVRSSECGLYGKRGKYVARLCEYVQATDYLSPSGAEDYLMQDRAEFDNRAISVGMHTYAHPVYRQQFKPFIPFASTIDLLFNEGHRAGEIVRSGRQTSRPLGVYDVPEG